MLNLCSFCLNFHTGELPPDLQILKWKAFHFAMKNVLGQTMTCLCFVGMFYATDVKNFV